MSFRIIKQTPGSLARAGELTTAHGVVPTPAFMPVASQASVKALTPADISEIGFPMVLSNTYHLYLRPGVDVIENLGGLHKFMGWPGSILTDSGGFQVFSLAKLRKVTDEGVIFKSHIDGSEHELTPEKAVQLQERLGPDVAMVLDECAPHTATFEQVRDAMRRTHIWAERSKAAHTRPDQQLWGIIQGGMYPELRQESAEFLSSLDFPGYALGGLSIGEPKYEMIRILDHAVPLMPASKSRYLMGVGSPEDLVEGVWRGIDLFDCALPTRVARNGALYTPTGRINIRNAVYATMADPVEPGCPCYLCRTFSAAYLHHLFNARELVAYRLATVHNLTFIARLMNGMRQAILDGTFADFRREFLAKYVPVDESVRLAQKEKWLRARDAEPE